MTWIFLLPMICCATLLAWLAKANAGESGRRQVLRSFFNMMIWGAITISVELMIAL